MKYIFLNIKLKSIIVFLIFLSLIFMLFPFRYKEVSSFAINNENMIIAIDAGHGGYDGGATDKSGTKEKDINLNISKFIKDELLKRGYKIILTRDADYSLNDKNASNKKRSDFNNRLKIIEDTRASLLISVHLNYFSDSKYSGAQVFYESKYEESKALAEFIQSKIKSDLDINNERKAAKIKNKYLFDNIKIPAVLVECGFLSNDEEANKLKDVNYQKKIAKVISNAVDKYYKNKT